MVCAGIFSAGISGEEKIKPGREERPEDPADKNRKNSGRTGVCKRSESRRYMESYIKEVDDAIDRCEKSQIVTELTNALFVVSSQLILNLELRP